MKRRAFFPSVLVVVGAFLAMTCVPAGDGVIPPSDRVYFPVGLAVTPVESGESFLYVVSSDFDLQFNQGTVQSLDLARLREVSRHPCLSDADCSSGGQRCDAAATEENGGVPSFFCVDTAGEYAGLPCGPYGENDPSKRAVAPGRCGPVHLTKPEDGGSTLIVDSVATSAFATDVVLTRRPTSGDEAEGEPYRMFVPVRGDSSLHFIDTDNRGRLHCGQPESQGSCSEDYRVIEGDKRDYDENDPDETKIDVPVEPYGIAADPSGRVIVVAHQAGGKASAFLNDWKKKPKLVYIEGALPTNPIGVAAIPEPKIVSALGEQYQAGYLVTFRNDASVHLLRFFDDGALDETPPEFGESRPFLFDVARTSITLNTSGTDSRGIVIDDDVRKAAEEACGDDADCLAEAAAVPLDVYVANRSPNSLLIGQTDRREADVAASDLPTFHDNVPLTQGPSRVLIGSVTTASGAREKRIFVICFDSALIYVYDPIRRRIESEIYTGRGPQALVFDPDPNVPLAYIGHFTDSYIGVVSLDQRFPKSYGSMLATLGTPTSPRASK